MRRRLFLAIVVIALATAAPAEAAEDVTMKASVNGRDLDSQERVRLAPDRPITVDLSITNRSRQELNVRSVQIAGEVLKLTFFAYEARIDLTVPPGETAERSVVIDLVGLEGQATGHIPARVTLLDVDRQEIVTDRFTVDVRGSFWSIYGIFGLVIAAVTLVLLLGVVLRLALGTLPPNRWSRAARFGIAGVGLGLTMAIALSATRVLAPHPNSSLSLLISCGIGLFLIGYLTPTPTIDETDEPIETIAESGGDIDLRTTAPASTDRSAWPVVVRPASAGAPTSARTEPTPAQWSDAVTDRDPRPIAGAERQNTVIRSEPLPPTDDD